MTQPTQLLRIADHRIPAADEFRSAFDARSVSMLIGEAPIGEAPIGEVYGPIIAANPKACELLAMSEAELCTMSLADMVDSEDLRMLSPSLEGEQAATVTMRRGDGSAFEAMVSTISYRNMRGERRNLYTFAAVLASSLRTAPGRWAPSLTPTQRRVLVQLTTHRSLQEIADSLRVSRNTVKTHTISIYRHLGVSGRGPAVERARELGLLS